MLILALWYANEGLHLSNCKAPRHSMHFCLPCQVPSLRTPSQAAVPVSFMREQVGSLKVPQKPDSCAYPRLGEGSRRLPKLFIEARLGCGEKLLAISQRIILEDVCARHLISLALVLAVGSECASSCASAARCRVQSLLPESLWLSLAVQICLRNLKMKHGIAQRTLSFLARVLASVTAVRPFSISSSALKGKTHLQIHT